MDGLPPCSTLITAACCACPGSPNQELRAAGLRPEWPILSVKFDLPHCPSQKNPHPSSEISCLQAIAGGRARAWQVGNLSFRFSVGRYKEKAVKEALAGLSANADMFLMSKCIPRDVHSWEHSSKAGQDSCEDPCLSGRLKSCLPQRTPR